MPTEFWSRIWSSIRNAFRRPQVQSVPSPFLTRADDILKVFLEDDVGPHSTPEGLLKLFLGHLSRDSEYRWDMRAWIDGGDLPKYMLTVKERAYEAICARIQQLKAEQAEGVARATAARAEEEAAEAEARTREVLALMEKHRSRVQKFLEIAYRKVATPDDYGDENPKALDDEIVRFLAKLADAEPKLCKPERPDTKLMRALGLEKDTWDGWYSSRYPLEAAIAKEVREQFDSYYRSRKQSPSAADVSILSGREFETHITGLLHQVGITDVSTTPSTGDQGGDLLFTSRGRRYVAQAKRYSASVGNKAVQEAHAAKGFYRCDEAWVITNSTFTPAARQLAKELGVILIDGDALRNWQSHVPQLLLGPNPRR